jgi:hypothetical protein
MTVNRNQNGNQTYLRGLKQVLIDEVGGTTALLKPSLSTESALLQLLLLYCYSTIRQRSARAEILEFYPTRPEEHLARTRSLSSNMLPGPHLSPTSIYSSPNEARSIYYLPWLSYH